MKTTSTGGADRVRGIELFHRAQQVRHGVLEANRNAKWPSSLICRARTGRRTNAQIQGDERSLAGGRRRERLGPDMSRSSTWARRVSAQTKPLFTPSECDFHLMALERLQRAAGEGSIAGGRKGAAHRDHR